MTTSRSACEIQFADTAIGPLGGANGATAALEVADQFLPLHSHLDPLHDHLALWDAREIDRFSDAVDGVDKFSRASSRVAALRQCSSAPQCHRPQRF